MLDPDHFSLQNVPKQYENRIFSEGAILSSNLSIHRVFINGQLIQSHLQILISRRFLELFEKSYMLTSLQGEIRVRLCNARIHSNSFNFSHHINRDIQMIQRRLGTNLNYGCIHDKCFQRISNISQSR